MDQHESTEWHANEKVNIHIPIENIISDESVAEIHQIFWGRFEQALRMQNSFGSRYGLPKFEIEDRLNFDPNNIDHLIEFLEQHSLSLINDYDIDIMFQMVSRIPHIKIYLSKNLLLIAAIAYSEAGIIAESKIFCSKLKKINHHRGRSHDSLH